MRVRLLITIVAAASTLLAAATAAAHPARDGGRIVALERPTPVREYAGRLLFSRWDGSAYRLSTWLDGIVRDLAIPPQDGPFDADVGPDARCNPSRSCRAVGAPAICT